MSRIWKKIRGRWQLYWQDDGDDPEMKYLSRQDKRSLLYGGFMISMMTLVLLLAAVTVSNYRADRENAESLEKVLDTLNAYLATATEDEYEDVAETIRHDLVYSQYGEDIESLIQYIPNTSDSCCLDRGEISVTDQFCLSQYRGSIRPGFFGSGGSDGREKRRHTADLRI